jgi:hypothetical protein
MSTIAGDGLQAHRDGRGTNSSICYASSMSMDGDFMIYFNDAHPTATEVPRTIRRLYLPTGESQHTSEGTSTIYGCSLPNSPFSKHKQHNYATPVQW